MGVKKKKRRLTKEEIAEIREWMDSAPPGRKPSIRRIARRYGVSRSSVMKSIGGQPPKRVFGSPIERNKQSVRIEPYTIKLPNLNNA